MRPRLQFETWHTVAMFAALLFSNLVARLIGHSLVNAVVVVLLITGSAYGIPHLKWSVLHALTLVLILTTICFSLDPRNSTNGAFRSIYIFALPLIALFAGASLDPTRARWLRPLFIFVTAFVGYGVMQAIVFYSGALDTLMSWDAALVVDARNSGATNLYQGDLLRFFGPMNSFFEYQLIASTLVPALWVLNRLNPGTLKLIHLYLLTALHFAFLALSVERTPIIVSAVLYLSVIRRPPPQFVATIFLALFSLGSSYVLLASRLGTSRLLTMQGDAIDRLVRVLTLDFSADEAIQARMHEVWGFYVGLFFEHALIGVGSGQLAGDSSNAPTAMQPHNAFLAYGLAFGLIGLLLLVAFLVNALLESRALERDTGRFVRGLIFAYTLVALVNVPFIGKTGVTFFLLIGLLLVKGPRRVPGESELRLSVGSSDDEATPSRSRV